MTNLNQEELDVFMSDFLVKVNKLKASDENIEKLEKIMKILKVYYYKIEHRRMSMVTIVALEESVNEGNNVI